MSALFAEYLRLEKRFQQMHRSDESTDAVNIRRAMAQLYKKLSDAERDILMFRRSDRRRRHGA